MTHNVLSNDFLSVEISTCLSVILNSIIVPPLKSTPKLSPLNSKSKIDKVTRIIDIKLNNL